MNALEIDHPFTFSSSFTLASCRQKFLLPYVQTPCSFGLLSHRGCLLSTRNYIRLETLILYGTDVVVLYKALHHQCHKECIYNNNKEYSHVCNTIVIFSFGCLCSDMATKIIQSLHE